MWLYRIEMLKNGTPKRFSHAADFSKFPFEDAIRIGNNAYCTEDTNQNVFSAHLASNKSQTWGPSYFSFL